MQGENANYQSVWQNPTYWMAALALTILIASGFIVWLLGDSFLGTLFPSEDTKSRYDAQGSTPFKVLLRENEHFAEGDRLARSGEYDAAIEAYNRALLVASDSVQHAQIKFKIADAVQQKKDYVQAIKLFKEIAENESYNDTFHAYAIQRLGIIFYTYGYGRPEISAEIFSGQPYESFTEQGGEALAYRKLFEYASSFKPLAVAETRIADWYANKLVSFHRSNELTGSTTQKFVSIIKKRLENADRDIEVIRGDSNASGLIPVALRRKAEVQKKLALIGIEGFTFEKAEESFRGALQVRGLLGADQGEDGFTRYGYALFLVEAYGAEREKDIQNLISVFAVGKSVDSAVEDFFRDARIQNRLKSHKQGLVFMASLSPDFMAYLKSIGWTSRDFDS